MLPPAQALYTGRCIKILFPTGLEVSINEQAAVRLIQIQNTPEGPALVWAKENKQCPEKSQMSGCFLLSSLANLVVSEEAKLFRS